MAILTFGGIVSTQAVGPASCSQRRTYLSATENKGKCVSQQEKKKKKKKEKEKKSKHPIPLGEPPF
jgi:hypothetical protein